MRERICNDLISCNRITLNWIR